jgi:hypothetical protein
MTEAWLIQASDSFWESVGDPPPFPRDLQSVVSLGLPVVCVTLPKLSVRVVEAWFQQRQTPYHFLCQDRSLCGCIVAAQGHAVMFVCADDDRAEQRFTVAHELAHYLLDYLQPRQQALDVLGAAILPVLDGARPPSPTERVHAALGRVTLGIYVNLMPRAAGGQGAQAYILQAEKRADLLALELLAPAEAALADLAALPRMQHFERLRTLDELLRTKYGLPRRIAHGYGSWLLRTYLPPSTADWLGLHR